MLLDLILGLGALVAGAEMLVRGASRLAVRAGISRLVVGLTVVALGTSAPELTVSIGSSWAGETGLALGNVVGSNVFNVLFILGLSALVTPLVVSSSLVRWDVPLGVAAAAGVLVLALDGRIGRLDGVLLVAGLVLYTGSLIVQARSEADEAPGEDRVGGWEKSAANDAPGVPTVASWVPASSTGPLASITDVVFVVAGLALLVVGADLFLDGAVVLATWWGLSELVIGLTVVAGGTSLPELATSVLAGVRGERDIAVGNVVGSNLFNLLGVLGAAAVVAPGGLPVSDAVLWFDLPVLLAVSLACLPIFVTGYSIARWEGALFLGYYGAYVAYLVLAATRHDALSTYSWVVGAFVVPLTVITVIVISLRFSGASDPSA